MTPSMFRTSRRGGMVIRLIGPILLLLSTQAGALCLLACRRSASGRSGAAAPCMIASLPPRKSAFEQSGKLLTVDQVKAVLISERNQQNEMIARMENRQINVSKLMGQHGERDDRQMVSACIASARSLFCIYLRVGLSLSICHCHFALPSASNCAAIFAT